MTDLSHPDAMIRLVAAVHRFRCPEIGNKKLSYVKSFKSTAIPHKTSKACVETADQKRTALSAALNGYRTGSSSGSTGAVSYEAVANAAEEYVPLIQAVLFSCEVQPDTARLDEKLVFEWTSGVEKVRTKKTFKSEALTYELAMAIACQGLGNAGLACDESSTGNFAAASKHFKLAAGQMEFLAQDTLPKWIARGADVDTATLPCETSVGVCEALKLLYLANAQQMAVATVLNKPDAPNYGLLAKLCLGIAEQLDNASATFKNKAPLQAPQLDDSVMALVAFQSKLQRSLSMYFLARANWADQEYGLAIAMMQESLGLTKSLDTGKKSGLTQLAEDVEKYRSHAKELFDDWDKDNKSIYFSTVPRPIPPAERVATGLTMMKPETFSLPQSDPLPLYKLGRRGILW